MFTFDTETALIAPGRCAPPMTCMSTPERVYHWTEAHTPLRAGLAEPLIVGANSPFDVLVTGQQFPALFPLWFTAYREDRVTDVLVRQKLLDIAAGRYRGYLNDKEVWIQYNYNLDDVFHRHTGKRLDKNTWRLRYGELRDVPIEQWEEGARMYALDDAVATEIVFWSQEEQRKQAIETLGADPLADEFRQARIGFSRYCMSSWGIKTNPLAVDRLELETHKLFDGIERKLRDIKWVRTEFKKREPTVRSKQDGTRDTALVKLAMKEAWAAKGQPDGWHKTDSGDVSLSAEACEASGSELLEEYATFGTQSAVINKDIPMLRAGAHYPIHTRFDLAASGRRTSSNPNIQNPRTLPGVRECFVPRPGKVFAQADVEGLELCTLAQTCIWLLGGSTLAKMINDGIDAHSVVASKILGLPYEEMLRRKKLDDHDCKEYQDFYMARQTGKVCNFGMPGGLGAASLVKFAKSNYDVVLTEEQARDLKQIWFQALPEMKEYFQVIDAMSDNEGLITLMQHKSKRIRGNIFYTAACNTFFQGLGADAMGDAGWRLIHAQYNERDSVMYGSRTVDDVHDEFIVETDANDTAHDVAKGLEHIIVSTLTEWLPDVKISAPPMLMEMWSKSAKATYDANGRLVPWKGEVKWTT